jgi:NADH:ubiquinone oxidoreductase subunit 4 (subunit M)
MHNRLAEGVESREIGGRDALVMVPLVACILALALYPGLITKRVDTSVEGTVAEVAFVSQHPGFAQQKHRGTGYAPIVPTSP